MQKNPYGYRLAAGGMLILATGLLVFIILIRGYRLTQTDETPEAEGLASPFPLQIKTLPTQTTTASPSVTVTATQNIQPVFSQTPTLTLTMTLTSSPMPVISTDTSTAVTTSPQPESQASEESDACPHPVDWELYTVQQGDTLFAFQLGSGSTFSVDEILAANCLSDRWIYEGQMLWLPSGAAENAPASNIMPTPFPTNQDAPPPPTDSGLTRAPQCPCDITIQPGWRLEQIAEKIDSLPVGFYGRDFLAITKELPQRDFLTGIPAGASLEGYMLPGTYTISNDMGARAFRDMLLDTFSAQVTFLGDAAGRGLNPYQAVILASVIQRESRSYDQQVLISSVFHNRLAAGKGLGATVTTQYAAGRSGNWWPDVHGMVSTYNSPYNTNIYAGLPPSPICSPGLDALRAAVYPADTGYMYFTGNCRGPGNVYATTYEEHLANVRCE